MPRQRRAATVYSSTAEKKCEGGNRVRSASVVWAGQGRSRVTNEFREQMIAMLPRLRKFAFALTGSEDLVQETCVKALGRAHQWQPGTQLDSWLYRIAQNQWIDTIRAGRRYAVTPPDEASLPDERSANLSAAANHEHRSIRLAVGELPPEQRAVVALVCINGCSYRETSDILEIPIGTVMSRLARARKALHDTLYSGETVAEAKTP
jgi:RNA polymerase sigma-70 factor (ECF subfamily)